LVIRARQDNVWEQQRSEVAGGRTEAEKEERKKRDEKITLLLIPLYRANSQ
jgi:hypothetical protein